MATGGNENLSDEIFNFKCTSCDKVNRQREAVKYCVECQGYCCQSCVDSHEMFPALSSHSLLDKSDFKKSIPTTDLPSVPAARCKLHETNIVNIYCGNHDTVGCSTCMVLDHRSCKDIQSIPDALETLFRKSDVAQAYHDVQEMKTVMESIKKLRQKLLEELNESRNKAINTVKEFKAEMECILKRLEKESIEEVEKEFRKLESGLNEEMKKAEDELDNLKVTAHDFRKSEGNNAQQFVSMKNVQKVLSHVRQKSRLLAVPTNAEIRFAVNTDVRDFLNKLTAFGSVKGNALSNPKRESVYSVKSSRDINIKLQNDTSDCRIDGLCLTEDYKLLVADNTNKKLKRVVNDLINDYFDLPGRPNNVCCISIQEAAVCLSNHSIQFVSLGNQMTCTRQIKLDHVCYGMAYKDDKLYITDNARSVYIYDLAGNLLVKMQKDSAGNNLFQTNRFVTLSDCGDRVYVADWHKGLVTLDSQGNHVDTFTDTDLINAAGVCTDSRGNVFVCGYNSQKVIQIAEDGQKKKGVVVQYTDGVLRPKSICFDRRQCMLFVAQSGNNAVKVFELC